MSDARERLSRMLRIEVDRSDSETSNTRERTELPESVHDRLATGQTPGATVFGSVSSGVQRGFGVLPAASSRRRGQRHDHTMHDHTDDRRQYSLHSSGVAEVHR